MSAVHALKLARAAGVRIRIDGEGLTLAADAPPPAAVLDLLALHKAQVMVLLRLGRDGRSGEDWLAFFNELAGIAESEGGWDRPNAELNAFEECVERWLALHPLSALSSETCAHCGKTIDRRSVNVSIMQGVEKLGVLHPECADRWHNLRRWEARRCLLWLLQP